jgi:hypothetical protein
MRLGRATLVDRRWRVGVTLSGHRIDHLQVSDQRSTKIAVAVVKSLTGVFNGGEGAAVASLGDLGLFRREFYECLSARADVLFELTDALLCTEGPVRSLVGLSLAPEHRRGHGALYDAVNHGRIELARLRISLAALPLPRAANGRLVLAVDVSPWLRPGREYLSGALVLPYLWSWQGPASDGSGLAVLGRGGLGDWSNIVDSGAGCDPFAAWR